MKNVLLFLALTIFFSCSLKYTQDNNGAEERIPEFVFENPAFIRYENNKEQIFLQASALEQYKPNQDVYAKDVKFRVKDSDGNITTEGECGLLTVNQKKDEYSLFDDINLTQHEQDVKLHAIELKWNKKTEQLITGRGSNISVESKGTTVYGSGFSASNATGSFQFIGAVSGVITTDESTEDE